MFLIIVYILTYLGNAKLTNVYKVLTGYIKFNPAKLKRNYRQDEADVSRL